MVENTDHFGQRSILERPRFLRSLSIHLGILRALGACASRVVRGLRDSCPHERETLARNRADSGRGSRPSVEGSSGHLSALDVLGGTLLPAPPARAGRTTARAFAGHHRGFSQHNQLEPARSLLRPALDHDLLLGEELDRIPALSMQVAEETLIPSATGEERHRGRNPDVDPNITGVSLITELARRGAAAGEEEGHEAGAGGKS